MDVIKSAASQCRVATPHDAVSNTECVYTFHTCYTTSILVNLTTFVGTVQELSSNSSSNNNNNQPETTTLFVRIQKDRVEKQTEDKQSSSNSIQKDPPTKLGINVEGGFQTDEDNNKYETVSNYSVVATNGKRPPTILAELPYTDTTKSDFPETVQHSVDSILNHVGTAIQQDVQAAWTVEDTPVSKYAETLPFVDNGKIIDPNPSSWKCETSGDTTNLWLNLSDGFIGGGRKHWDGSGGSNGALDHYIETNKAYPLVVKLGTITADISTADCYSYASEEDGPVLVPNLATLLEKRGIHITNMQKTVQSTAELEVSLNQNYAFDAITECGQELEIVTGPGCQGLQNLGNSCYMNSIFQLLLSNTVPELANRYGGSSVLDHPFFQHVSPRDAPTDVLCQTAKLGTALTSGLFGKPATDRDSTHPKYRLAPRMMKYCIGKDHVDFKTNQQQDAAQFLQYYLERLDRAELGADSIVKDRIHGHTSSHLFSFSTTSRMVCQADKKIKYKDSAPETIWSLRIPMPDVVQESEQKRRKADNASPESGTEKHVPTVSLSQCLEAWSAETMVDDLRWPHLGNAVANTQQTVSLTNFPRYLILQLQRYELGPDWVPIKLEVNLDVPDELDLTPYKSKGPQDGEALVPEEDNDATMTEAKSNEAIIDEAALSQLMDMGFSLNSCKRALNAVGGSNVEAAMGWVFEHNTDPDFNDPLPENAGGGAASDSGVDEGVVQSLVASLGAFTPDQVRAALKATSGAADRAADWLFSHMDDLDGAIAALDTGGTPQESKGPLIPLEDGEGKYSLVGMVSHIGKNTGSGHYVAHLKKDGKWVIFNDEKVALSHKPPYQHAYLYLFQRKDTMGSPNPNY